MGVWAGMSGWVGGYEGEGGWLTGRCGFRRLHLDLETSA